MQKRIGRGPDGRPSRLKPVERDPLAEYGLPSKGEKRLLSPKVQEAYYATIAERYLAFCSETYDRDGLLTRLARLSIAERPPPARSRISCPLPPPAAAPPLPSLPSTDTLSQVLAALRKLREALIASHRHDAFATQVFLFSARLGILASAWETYLPAVLHLLRVHSGLSSPLSASSEPPSPPSPPSPPLTSTEHREVATYLVLDTACRRGDLSAAYTLRRRHLRHYHCRHDQHYRSHSHTLQQHGPGSSNGLSSDGNNNNNATSNSSEPDNEDDSEDDDANLTTALRALATDNWIAWLRARHRRAGEAGGVRNDPYRAALMSLADRRVRARALRALARAYLGPVPAGFLEAHAGGVPWGMLRGEMREELRDEPGVVWEVEEGAEGEGDGEREGKGRGTVVVFRKRGQRGQPQGSKAG